jgi:hypothetical protein
MNKQELIKKYKELWDEHSPFHEPVPYTSMVKLFLKDLKQLDEQKPVKVPQFVADWIEYCKFTHVDLQHALIVGDVYFYNYANQKDFSKLKEFLETENNQELFARAWLDGYEVEEEKRYYVRFKQIEDSYSYLTLIKHLHAWTLMNIKLDKKFRSEHTRKQLEEADFGWVFDCPGIEIEEVE